MSAEDALAAQKDRALRLSEWAHGPGGLFEIFAAVEKNYVETLLRSDIEDGALREKAYHRVNALRDVKRTMDTMLAEGAGADAIIMKMSRANAGRRK